MPVSSLLSSYETIQLVRDIILIAVLLISFVAIFVFSILGVQLYRRFSAVLRRAEGTLENVQTLTDELSRGVLKPLAALRERTSRIRPFLSLLFGGRTERE